MDFVYEFVLLLGHESSSVATGASVAVAIGASEGLRKGIRTARFD